MFNPITSSFFHKLQDWVHSHPSLEYQFYIKGKKSFHGQHYKLLDASKHSKKEIKFGQLPSTNYPVETTKRNILFKDNSTVNSLSIPQPSIIAQATGMVKAQNGFYNQKQIHDPRQKMATQVLARYGPTKTKPKGGHHNKTSKHAALPAKKCWE